MKKYLAVTIVMVMMLSVFSKPSYAEELTLKVVVDNEELTFPDAQPFVDSNYRTQTPARFIGEALGASVSWDGDLQQAKFVKGEDELLINIGSKTYQLNGVDKEMDTLPVIVDNRTFVPARYVAEAFGAEVSWDGAVKTVYVKSDSTTTITTGSGDIEYYDGIALDPINDIDKFGTLREEKLLEFYVEAADNFRFIKENGVYYIEGEYPELPDGVNLKVHFVIRKNSIMPITYSSGTIGDPRYKFPIEGSFRKEVVEQDLSNNDGYMIKLFIFNYGWISEGTFYIETPSSQNDNTYVAEFAEAGGAYKIDRVNDVNFDNIFMWE